MSERLARAVAQVRHAIREDLPQDLRAEALLALMGISAAVRRAELRKMPQHEVKRATALFQGQLFGELNR